MRQSKIFLLASALILVQNAPAQTAPPSTAPTVTVYSREVTLDVDVTDAQGKPVHGLKQSDFTITENGQPQSPRSFREHRPDEPLTTAATPALPPNTFTNEGPPESVRPLEILLLDSMDTPVANQAILRQRIGDFVDKMPTGTRVAVMYLSPTGQLSIVQGFTADRDTLRKALKSHKVDIGIPPLEDFGQEPDESATPQIQGNAQATAAFASAAPKVNQDVECNHAADRVQYTSNAFAQIARYVSGMPGRKNLIWYSGAFPTRMAAKQGVPCYDSREDMTSADDLLLHSHVVVYPVDPRALDIIAKEGPDSRIAHIQTYEHLTMESIASQTGGKAFYNNNDLAAAAIQAIEAGLNYYSINYAPTNQNWDTRARHINVTVDQPDLTLVYRRTYSAVPGGRPSTGGGRPIEKTTPVQSAMMRGAIQPTEVLFHVNVAPAAATETAVAPGNKPDPKLKPPYRRLTLSYNVDASGLHFDQAEDGTYHSQFEYAVNVYDANDGRLLNSNQMAAKPALPPAIYQNMVANGIKLHQDIDVPANGQYILRVGIHDLTTDHVGATEIPTSSITP